MRALHPTSPGFRPRALAAVFGILLLAGCATAPPESIRPARPAPAFPELAGKRQAQADIAAGRVRLMVAGTRGIHAPGVPARDRRFDSLPRKPLPRGCTEPAAPGWMRYAEAYNAVVVAHVRGGR